MTLITGFRQILKKGWIFLICLFSLHAQAGAQIKGFTFFQCQSKIELCLQIDSQVADLSELKNLWFLHQISWKILKANHLLKSGTSASGYLDQEVDHFVLISHGRRGELIETSIDLKNFQQKIDVTL